MKFKEGVILNGIKPVMLFAAYIVAVAFLEHGVEATVTSALDGKHSDKSLHYSGLAIDVRTRDVLPEILRKIIGKIRERLGEDYDVVEESTHLHIEYDPE